MISSKRKKLYWLRLILSFALLFLPALIKWTDILSGLHFNYWKLLIASLCFSAGSAFIQKEKKESVEKFLIRLGASLLFSGAIYAAAARLVLVTDYPFPQYWSEGNRFYDYSTLLGGFRYQTADGSRAEAFITPGMALPWSIPFLAPDLTIRAFRLYYQLMWIIPSFMLGCVAWRMVRDDSEMIPGTLIFSVWAYLFIEQGPVYTPLVLAAILVAAAIRMRILPGMLLVLAASIYAHYSRWTWSFAPGLWAGLLALLDVNRKTIEENRLRALKKPFLLGLAGLAGGFLLPLVFGSEMASSLINPLPFTARQPLLWERLLPNSILPAGILLSAVWIVLPTLLVMVLFTVKNYWRMHWLPGAAVVIVLAGFFTVGLIASVKIGGGSNLHNLDMFLLTIVMMAPYVISGVLGTVNIEKRARIFLAVCMLIAMVAPTAYVLQKQERTLLPDADMMDEALQTTRIWVLRAAERGKVLFIDHRQLLAFGYIEGVELVDKYEKKLLMDMAMSGRADYFDGFYADLTSRRFQLIVNEPAFLAEKNAGFAFSEENNAYVEWVVLPLLCNYYPIFTSKEAGLELLLPRTVDTVIDPRCEPYTN